MPRCRIAAVGQRCLGILGCYLLCALAAAADEQVTEADILRLQSDISALQAELNNFQGQQADVQQALRQSELAMGKLAREIDEITAQQQRQQATLESLQRRREELQQLKAEQQEHIARQLVVTYQLGRESRLKLLLNQQDPEQLSRALTYMDYFNQARLKFLQDYAGTIVEIDRVEPQIAAETVRLQESRQQLEQQSRALAVERNKREQALASITRALQDKNQELATRQQERARLEQLLKAVQEAVTNLQLPSEYREFAERRGQMAWPTDGKRGNAFGAARGSGGLKWTGIQLFGKEGDTVRAIHNGRVVYADWFRGQGLLIILDHGNGYMSLYGYNQSLLRQTGDWVAAGEPIATVGNSGGQPNPSLYFEIRKDGKPLDPRRWCRK